jgi:hypothetical protein
MAVVKVTLETLIKAAVKVVPKAAKAVVRVVVVVKVKALVTILARLSRADLASAPPRAFPLAVGGPLK